MKFTVKLPINTKEVNQANQENAQINAFNESERKKPINKQERRIPVPVPELVFVEKPLLVDASKITLAHINQDNEIQFKYEGEMYKAEYDLENWNALEERFK